MDLYPVWLSFQVATSATALTLLAGLPLAWLLARRRFPGHDLLAGAVVLPLVLPPTVLGFYLLVLLGPHGPVGAALEAVGLAPLVFTFPGLVLGSVIYSLPFVVQPLQNAFEAIPERALETAATLRASARDTFFSVVLPLAKPGFLTASVLGFAHTVGEFGVVLMIGGNIPGETRTISIAIYDRVQAFDEGAAASMSALLIGLSLFAIAVVYLLAGRGRPR